MEDSARRQRVSLAQMGMRLSDFFEHWFPDAFALALIAVIVVFFASVLLGNAPAQTASWFGEGFWDLIKFTMQMTMIIVSGYALATAPPVYRLIEKMARIPQDGKSAAAFVGLFSMLTSLVSWSFSLIFSGLLAREVAHRVRGADYRAVGAAAYLGLGSVWALGLSSSAALIMAAPASLPAPLLHISGVIPFTQTLWLWQSGLLALILIAVSVSIAYFSAPDNSRARGMKEMGVEFKALTQKLERPKTPGESLEYSPWLALAIGALGALYLMQEIWSKGFSEMLELNHYIFAFLTAALLLHGRPKSFVAAVASAVPSAAGVLIQYPLYAGILKMMTESGLAKGLAHLFIEASSRHSYPLLIGIYSALLGLFVPSAGGKWLIEAPYLLEAAKTLHVHLGWVVQIYNAAEALPNLIHPFWMLPLLGILSLKPRDIVGYSALQFVVHVPVVLFLVWLLNYTL